jgi:hypothetical protein
MRQRESAMHPVFRGFWRTREIEGGRVAADARLRGDQGDRRAHRGRLDAKRRLDLPHPAAARGRGPEQIQLREIVHKLHHAIGQVFHAADEEQQKRIRETLDETSRGIYATLAEQG